MKEVQSARFFLLIWHSIDDKEAFFDLWIWSPHLHSRRRRKVFEYLQKIDWTTLSESSFDGFTKSAIGRVRRKLNAGATPYG